jgi:hypothetical protein
VASFAQAAIFKLRPRLRSNRGPGVDDAVGVIFGLDFLEFGIVLAVEDLLEIGLAEVTLSKRKDC